MKKKSNRDMVWTKKNLNGTWNLFNVYNLNGYIIHEVKILSLVLFWSFGYSIYGGF